MFADGSKFVSALTGLLRQAIALSSSTALSAGVMRAA